MQGYCPLYTISALEFMKVWQLKEIPTDTSHGWSRTQVVTHPSTNTAQCRLTSVKRQILITLCHNS